MKQNENFRTSRESENYVTHKSSYIAYKCVMMQTDHQDTDKYAMNYLRLYIV